MSPAQTKTLRLLVSQVLGAASNLDEAVLRLRSMEAVIADVGYGLVENKGIAPEMASIIASQIENEVRALGTVYAQLAMVRALARAIED